MVPTIGMTEQRWCQTLGRNTAQCAWRRRYGFDVPLPPRTPHGTDWSQGPDWSRLGVSPYEQWWELSEASSDEVTALRRQRWWWLLGGVAAGFLIGGVVYAKV